MVKFNDLNGLNESKALEKIYLDFLDYGKRREKALKLKYGFNDGECATFIASSLFNRFMNYYEDSVKSNNAKIDCVIHVYAILKIILKNMNYASYEAMKSSKTITVIDVLKKWEIRDSRSEAKYCRYFDGDETFKMSLVTSYGNPETELLKKEALIKLHVLSRKIKNHKKYNELLIILNKEKKEKKDENFLCYFKKSNGLKCSSAELLELITNY